MSSRELYAELTHRAYVESLRKELDACLENVIAAADELESDIWHVEADIALRTNVERFRELHHELGEVQEEDPEYWLKTMMEAEG